MTALGNIIADFASTLNLKVAIGATSATLDSATDDDSVALPTGTYFFTLDADNSSKEYIKCTLTGTALTSIQSFSRQGALTTGFARSHRKTASVKITDFGVIRNMINALDGTDPIALLVTDLTFSGNTTQGFVAKSLTTTERDALTPTNGAIIYNSTAGEFQIRQGGAWATMASGSVQPNSSTTVAGKVEIATDAEITDGTATGGTGAVLVPTPVQIKKSISLKNADTTTAETDYFIFNDTSASAEDKKILKSDLRNDLAASVTLKGTSELSTDAEALAGTDEERYTNPKQLHSSRVYKVGTTTYDISTANGTQTIAHGLGRIPKYVTIKGIVGVTDNGLVYGYTQYNGTTQVSESVSKMGNPQYTYYTTFRLGNALTDIYTTGVVTFDATNINIAWTKSGSPTGTWNINWSANT